MKFIFVWPAIFHTLPSVGSFRVLYFCVWYFIFVCWKLIFVCLFIFIFVHWILSLLFSYICALEIHIYVIQDYARIDVESFINFSLKVSYLCFWDFHICVFEIYMCVFEHICANQDYTHIGVSYLFAWKFHICGFMIFIFVHLKFIFVWPTIIHALARVGSLRVADYAATLLAALFSLTLHNCHDGEHHHRHHHHHHNCHNHDHHHSHLKHKMQGGNFIFLIQFYTDNHHSRWSRWSPSSPSEMMIVIVRRLFSLHWWWWSRLVLQPRSDTISGLSWSLLY